jgi:putative copper export protein
MNIFMVVMRLIHIPASVFWVGGVLMMVTFISSSARAVGEDATKFMQHFSLRSGFQQSMAGAGVLAVVSGYLMYYHLFGWIAPLNTGAGLALTLGGTAGLFALLIGAFVIGRGTNRMREIAGEIASSGGPPKPDQLAEMGALQERLGKAGGITAILMVIALIGMTLSEYFAL